MLRFKKIAVTMPVETYQALEAARRRTGSSRSEVVALAVKDWLRGLDASEVRKRYVAGYLALPESGDDEAIVTAATADWSAWKPGAPSKAAEPRRGRTRR